MNYDCKEQFACVDRDGLWLQSDSNHSLSDNPKNHSSDFYDLGGRDLLGFMTRLNCKLRLPKLSSRPISSP